jgi:hypothetical protein
LWLLFNASAGILSFLASILLNTFSLWWHLILLAKGWRSVDVIIYCIARSEFHEPNAKTKESNARHHAHIIIGSVYGELFMSFALFIGASTLYHSASGAWLGNLKGNHFNYVTNTFEALLAKIGSLVIVGLLGLVQTLVTSHVLRLPLLQIYAEVFKKDWVYLATGFMMLNFMVWCAAHAHCGNDTSWNFAWMQAGSA